FSIFPGETDVSRGEVVFSGNNDYTTITELHSGTLTIRNSSALGATSGGTVIVEGTLQLDGGVSVGAETLATHNSEFEFLRRQDATLRSVNGTNEWAGQVTWSALSEGVNRVDVASGSELRLGGSVSGDGAWEKVGVGDLTLFAVSGGLNFIPINDYTGTFIVRDGRVNLDKFGLLTALSGPLVIGDGTAGAFPQVRLFLSNQIPNSAPIT